MSRRPRPASRVPSSGRGRRLPSRCRSSSRFKRNWGVRACVYYSPFNREVAILRDRFLNALENVEIVTNLIKQILDRRGIAFTPSFDTQLNRSAHDPFALQGRLLTSPDKS